MVSGSELRLSSSGLPPFVSAVALLCRVDVFHEQRAVSTSTASVSDTGTLGMGIRSALDDGLPCEVAEPHGTAGDGAGRGERKGIREKRRGG